MITKYDFAQFARAVDEATAATVVQKKIPGGCLPEGTFIRNTKPEWRGPVRKFRTAKIQPGFGGRAEHTIVDFTGWECPPPSFFQKFDAALKAAEEYVKGVQ